MANIDHYISVTQVKAQFFALIRRLYKQKETVAITRDGVPTAVLLSMDQFEGLMETIEVLSDEKTMRLLRRSMRQAQAGKWVDSEAVFGDPSR